LLDELSRKAGDNATFCGLWHIPLLAETKRFQIAGLIGVFFFGAIRGKRFIID
jgi:hypothetical protein